MSMPSLCTEGPHPFIDLDMGKYIDANRLCAEIEKTYKSEIQPWLSGVSATSAIYDYVLPLIDSLQQERPEVDLEKETIIDYVHNHYHYDKDFDGYGHSNLRPVFTREDLVELARHFFELGLNARKEENK